MQCSLQAVNLLARLTLCVALLAPSAVAQRLPKKAIEFGWDVPDTAFMREHIRTMEERPFDGLVFRLRGAREGQPVDGWSAFTKAAWQAEWFDNCIEDLRATDFERFHDNFILAWSTPGDAEWFNDEHWRAFCGNIAIIARVAKQGGQRGICFDPEPYGEHNPWLYPAQKHQDTKSFTEYARQARRRGAEFMQAIQSEYPDVTILALFGMSVVRSALEARSPREVLTTHGYGLYPSFINGILDVISDEAIFVDGHENAYWYQTPLQFYQGYHLMHHQALRLIAPENRDKYRGHVRAGFGLYMDANWNKEEWGWHPEDPSRHYYPPEKFEENATNALAISDEYVWIYSEQPNWWTGDKLPQEYHDALAAARRAAREGGTVAVVRREALYIRRLAGRPPVIDGLLNDPAWEEATRVAKFVLVGSGSEPKQPTEASVTYDEAALYVAFRCFAADPQHLKAEFTERDTDVWRDDCVEVFVSEGEAAQPFCHFILNSINTQWDARGLADTDYNPEWRSAAKLFEAGWCAEVAVPWAAMGRAAPSAGTKLRANVAREEQRCGEISSWSPFLASFLEPHNFGFWTF